MRKMDLMLLFSSFSMLQTSPMMTKMILRISKTNQRTKAQTWAVVTEELVKMAVKSAVTKRLISSNKRRRERRMKKRSSAES
jgi:hypothetical protein